MVLGVAVAADVGLEDSVRVLTTEIDGEGRFELDVADEPSSYFLVGGATALVVPSYQVVGIITFCITVLYGWIGGKGRMLLLLQGINWVRGLSYCCI